MYDLTKHEYEDGYERKITAKDGNVYDLFGNSVAISGNYIIIGAQGDDYNRGSIYVYDLTKRENEEGYERKITASDGEECDNFGTSVAISGNYIIIGAPHDNDNGISSGSVYVYDLTKRLNEEGYERKITPSDGETGAWYGISVDIEGNYIVVGAPGYESGIIESVYVYDLTKKESEDGYERKITESDRTDSNGFGNSVAIDGNQVVVGARWDDDSGIDSGSIYVYDLTKEEYEQGYERKITASDGESQDLFGNSVAIDGDYVVVGVYGDSVMDNLSGSMYIYDLSKGENEEGYERKITASDREVDDGFGYNVAISGNYLLTGAYKNDYNGNSGFVYVYVNKPCYKITIDELSGVNTIEVTKDGIEINIPNPFMLIEEGNYKIKVIDNAGNETLFNLDVSFE